MTHLDLPIIFSLYPDKYPFLMMSMLHIIKSRLNIFYLLEQMFCILQRCQKLEHMSFFFLNNAVTHIYTQFFNLLQLFFFCFDRESYILLK